MKRYAGVSCLTLIVTGVSTLLTTRQVLAQEASQINTGDTAWMLTSAALVLMMTAPGLALFYGGLVRRKNSLATIMQSFVLMALISVQKVVDAVVGLRVIDEDEYTGLDLSQHGENSYTL